MNLTNSIKLFLYSLPFLLSACGSKATNDATKQPNILLILCDDLGYNDVGFNGSTEITTPTLDKLATNGTIFRSAYVAHPFCGPSRASLMTGRYAHTIGAQFNLPPNDETIKMGIDLNETFISTALQNAGYYTGAIGKWHLGSTGLYHPNKRGFDDYYGFLGGGHNYFPEQFNAQYEQQKKSGKKVIFEYLLPLTHNGKAVHETEYVTDGLSREAVRFVNDAKKKQKPFFLYLAYNAPHVPLQAKKEDLKKFAHIKDKDRRTYAAMVYAVDRGVHRVVETLKQNGQFENTLIVFLSDNGGKTSRGANNFPLREGKGSTCEGGYRVPMFFHWPNNVPAGIQFDHPVTALDFYPTFTALAGTKIPDGKVLEGKNIWPNILDGSNPHKDEMIYALRHREGYTDVGARRNEWKALKINQEKWHLYNIKNDISENTDLSAEYPDTLKALVSQTKKWSDTHIQPLWWHNKQTGIEWKAEKMPHFEKTFSLEK